VSERRRAALFCDLVGTLVAMDETRQLPLDCHGQIRIELLPGVKRRLASIRDHLIFVVTNQAGIKRGRVSLAQIESALRELNAALDGILSGWQICPHDDADNCDCRKPKDGMVRRLASAHQIDLQASTMVGDQQTDAEAASRAGVGRFIYAGDFFRSL